MEKVCTNCNELKLINLFPKSGKWYRNKCKKCTSYGRIHERELKSEENKKYQKEYRENNSLILSEKDKIRNEMRKDYKNEQGKIYYQENKKHIINRNFALYYRTILHLNCFPFLKYS